MFDETLLDSSPLRAPVLARRHYVTAVAAGIAGFLVALRFLPLLLMPTPSSVQAARSVVVGAALMFHTLMLCYVHADARRLGLRGWVWTGLTSLLSLFGFVLYLTYSASRTRDWKRATMPVAYILEVALASMLVLVPLIYTEALPRTTLSGMLLAPSPPPAAPLPRGNTAIRPIRRLSQKDLLTSPVKVPKVIAVIQDGRDVAPEAPDTGVVGVVPGSPLGGMGVVPYGIGPIRPPPPPPPKRDATNPKQTRIRIGGQVEAAKLIFQLKPEYPPLAKLARVQGSVRLEAVISADGTIQNLRILGGHTLLVKAAIDAVAHWRYQPTLLNGDPVEVITEIDVNFTLE
jgi:periplasmic protein TonB